MFVVLKIFIFQFIFIENSLIHFVLIKSYSKELFLCHKIFWIFLYPIFLYSSKIKIISWEI